MSYRGGRRSPSPRKNLSEDEQNEITETQNRAREAQRKRFKKTPSVFDKYGYHIVIGGFILICVLALGSTFFKSSRKLNVIPVNDDDEISRHNSEGHSFQVSRNDFFSDMMMSDAKDLARNLLSHKQSLPQCPEDDGSIIPQSYNFYETHKECKNTVHDQGNCSSSYAHAAASAVSNRFCQQSKYAINEQLSAQSAINCDQPLQQGCKGGSVSRAFEYARKTGFVNQTCFPHSSDDENPELCDNDCDKFKIIDFCVVRGDEKIKREIYKNGPVVAVIPLYRDFLIYSSGVYTLVDGVNKFQGGHAVKIVGWNSEGNNNYWIIENSWGTSWGEQGFARVAIGQPQLQLDEYALAPGPNVDNDSTEDAQNASNEKEEVDVSI